MQVPGALLEIGWDELDQAVQRQAKLKKSQRELGMRLNGLEQETNDLQETFVRTAQSVYEAMSAGDLEEVPDDVIAEGWRWYVVYGVRGQVEELHDVRALPVQGGHMPGEER